MVLDIVQSQDILNAFAYVLEQDLIPGDLIVDLAIFIEILEGARIAIIHEASWNARHNIVIVHEAVGGRAEIHIEAAGKILVADARLAEGIKPIDRMSPLLSQFGYCQSSQRAAQAVTGHP